MGHCGVNYDPLPRLRPEAGATRRRRSTNGDIKLIPMLQRRKAMTESAQSFADVADDARVSETPLVDKGFASVRKIGNGLNATIDRKSTRLNSSHGYISYAVFCLKKKRNCSLTLVVT